MSDSHPRPVQPASSPALLSDARARLAALERRHSSDGDDLTTDIEWVWVGDTGGGAPLEPDWSPWLDDGPVAFWPLLSDLLDVSGNDYHLSLASGSYLIAGGLTGDATFTSSASVSGSAWTVEAVIDMNTDYPVSILGEMVVGEGTSGVGMAVYHGPGLGQPFWLGGPGFTIGPGPYESTPIRHHIAITYSSGALKLYVDGALYDTNSGGSGGGGGAIGVGIDPGSYGTFEPSKSYVAVYPSALTAVRVAAHAAAAGFTS